MEKLLNKLTEKGWKPFGIKSDNIWLYCLSDNKIVISYYDFDTEWECNHEDKWCDLRQLTSKESWLWQFVCKNGMIKNPNIDRYWKDYFELDHIEYYQSDFQYWIIESALTDEEDLEKFLLDNIKVEWN